MGEVIYTPCTYRDPRDEYVVRIYTGAAIYEVLNRFLSKRDSLARYQMLGARTYTSLFYHYITGSNDRQMNLPFLHSFTTIPEVESHWDEIEWFQNIFFQYTMDLYHAIARCPLQKTSSLVYRGVERHYLKEDPSKAYPITTFLSTSVDRSVAKAFSNGHLYYFYVMPDVACVYYGDREQELIINPYVYCAFIKKITFTDKYDNIYTIYYYTLFSTPIVPPNTFPEFMEFRDSIVGHYSMSTEGGSVEVEMEPVRNINTNRRNYKNTLSMSRRKRNNMTKRVSLNRVEKQANKRGTMPPMPSIPPEIASLNARYRLSAPIGIGAKGVPLTKKMKEIVQHSRKLFDSFSTL